MRRHPLIYQTAVLPLNRIEVPNWVFDDLNVKLSMLFNDQRSIKMLAETTKSLSEYKLGNFSTSLVLSWFVIESYISNYWSEFLDSKSEDSFFYDENGRRIDYKRMSRERKDKLVDGKDYTVSVILNILELSNALDFNTFRKINSIRECRNAIIHRDERRIHKFDLRKYCQYSFELIQGFLQDETGLLLLFNLNIPMNEMWHPFHIE